MIAGIGLGAVVAVAAGAVLALALAGRGSVELAGATPGASASDAPIAAATPSTEPMPSTEPPSTPTPGPTPPPNEAIANRSIADVKVDELNLRAAGNESAEILGQLRAGARLFTIGAPGETDGTYWYRVGVAAGPFSESDDCFGASGCEIAIGWVASPMTGNPWIEAVEIGCPALPVSSGDLASLAPLERLHCYGGSDIAVTGTIDHPCCGYVGPVRLDPVWLASPTGNPFFHDGSLEYHLSPEQDLEMPERGTIIRATAHFDDPASPTCRQSIDPNVEPYGADLWSPAAVVLYCRTNLVVTDYEATGTQDLGPEHMGGGYQG